jgi:hypothetical protein
VSFETVLGLAAKRSATTSNTSRWRWPPH